MTILPESANAVKQYEEDLKLLSARIKACDTLVDYVIDRPLMDGRRSKLDTLSNIATYLTAELSEHEAGLDKFKARLLEAAQ